MRTPLHARPSWTLYLLFAAAVSMAGCGSRPVKNDEPFRPDTPFSKIISGGGDVVCWSVKRAFLSQGYMLDRSGESVILSGTKDSQLDKRTNLTLRLQTTCVDNRDGTSTVFATASREVNRLQKVTSSVSAGVSIATVTVPQTSEDALRIVKRETIQDPAFYESFYHLVQDFSAQEQRKSRGTSAQEQRDSRDSPAQEERRN